MRLTFGLGATKLIVAHLPCVEGVAAPSVVKSSGGVGHFRVFL